jgi:hypothetical protein
MSNSDYSNEERNEENDEELFTYGEDSAADLRFRSIRVESAHHADHFTAFQQSANFNVHQPVRFQQCESNDKASEAIGGDCPSAPFRLTTTSFNIINSDYISVLQSVSENLCNHENFDFGFFPSEHMVRKLGCVRRL